MHAAAGSVATELSRTNAVKYLRWIELVAGYRQLGDGQRGFREDTQLAASDGRESHRHAVSE